uniref:Transmembrane protein n=1 Tax=Heterorhabditis bacteriophora TaxID=37862 RepID=A0A1I7W6B0_HETBA
MKVIYSASNHSVVSLCGASSFHPFSDCAVHYTGAHPVPDTFLIADMHNWLLLIIAFYSKILTNLWLFPIFFSVIFLKKPPILSLSLFNISTREPKQILSSQTRNERLYEENDILRQYKSTIADQGDPTVHSQPTPMLGNNSITM